MARQSMGISPNIIASHMLETVSAGLLLRI